MKRTWFFFSFNMNDREGNTGYGNGTVPMWKSKLNIYDLVELATMTEKKYGFKENSVVIISYNKV
jgi:hypothetical protein